MKFSVKTKEISRIGEEFESCAKTLKAKRNGLESIMSALTDNDSLAVIRNSLQDICEDLDVQQSQLVKMNIQLQCISKVYANTERRVQAKSLFFFHQNVIKQLHTQLEEQKEKIYTIFIPNPVNDFEISSIVFDENGMYGGDQEGPKKIEDEALQGKLLDIVYQYYPDMTKDDAEAYLKKANSEGCGYVAMINTIFVAYEGREREFEERFGFSMYDGEGDLNYNHLFVDFYSATDNHYLDANGKDAIDPYRDYDEKKDGAKEDYTLYGDKEGSGSSQYDREYLTEKYLADHGISADVQTNRDVTIHNFEEISKRGEQVIVAFRSGNLYNMDGTVRQVIHGGHAMVVTGVTSDGKMIVSSWGAQYYILPDEVITVTNDDGSTSTTSMTFSTIQYHK